MLRRRWSILVMRFRLRGNLEGEVGEVVCDGKGVN